MNQLRRHIAVGLGLIVLGGVTAGCSAAEPVPSDEAQSWLDQLDFVNEEMLAAYYGSPAKDFAVEGPVYVGFEPTPVSSAEFSCIGEERMSVEMTIQHAGEDTTLREDDLLCTESPHTLNIALEAVDAVRAVAVSADRTGAWSVVVRGATD